MHGTEPTSSIVTASYDIQRPMPSIRGERERARDSSVHVPLDRKLFPESPQDIEPVAGTRLGHFVIEEQIGRGGMGAVFRAVDQRLNRVVALKVLAPDQSRDPAAVQRFLNEARAAARLDHENIARVFFIGEDQGLQFIAFEFVTGTNVREFLHIRGKLPVEEAVNYTLQVALALRHTAAAGVVHRDIKPSNIVVSATGRAKLVDLGLARTQSVEQREELTVAGTALGTFDYISPEQARDPRQVDVRSDIYSLGCTLYHMLAGEPPFPQGTMFEKVIEHHGSCPPDPSLKNPSVSPQLARVVQRMMASRPDERYQSPDPLIQDLVAIAQSMGLRATSPDSPVWVSPLNDYPGFWESNRGWLLTLAMLLVIALLIDRFPWDPNRASISTSNASSNAEPTAGEPLDEDSQGNPIDEEGPSDVSNSSDARIPYDVQLSHEDAGSTIEHPAAISQQQTGQDAVESSSGLGAGVASVDIGAGVASNLSGNPGDGPDLSTASSELAGDNEDDDSSTVAIAPSVAGNPFTVRGPSGLVEGTYPTLEAACVEAPDNSQIEIAYSGAQPLRESAIRIAQKRLRIQSAAGTRAVIEFEPALGAGISQNWNCFEIVDGALAISGVDIVVRAKNGTITSVFSLIRSRELTVTETTLTLENSSGAQAQFINLPLPSSADRMEMMATEVPRIDFSHCLIRGSGAFLWNDSESSLDARFQQTAFAISDNFLRIEGSQTTRMDQVTEGPESRVEFDHCTCLLGRSLLSMDVPMESPVPVVRFDVQDSIVWITSSVDPMIDITGEKEMDELMNALQWRGFINHIHVAGPWWVINAPFSTVGAFETWNEREWRDFWSDADDQPLDEPLLPQSIAGPWSSVQASDLMLQMSEETTPLISGDGRGSGVDWTQGALPAGFPRVN